VGRSGQMSGSSLAQLAQAVYTNPRVIEHGRSLLLFLFEHSCSKTSSRTRASAPKRQQADAIMDCHVAKWSMFIQKVRVWYLQTASLLLWRQLHCIVVFVLYQGHKNGPSEHMWRFPKLCTQWCVCHLSISADSGKDSLKAMCLLSVAAARATWHMLDMSYIDEVIRPPLV